MRDDSSKSWKPTALRTVSEWWSYPAAACCVLVFFILLIPLVVKAWPHLSWSFLVEAPTRSGRSGGVLPVLVSTLLLLGVAMAVATPTGLAAAILLSEVTQKRNLLARCVGISLDVLAGVPSIVYGLFGNAFFCIYLGLGFSILSGGLTLACMVLPIFVRTVEAGLVAVQDDWKLGAAALGMSKWSTLVHILLPAAAPAIAVGLVLGTGRALAETAALVYTSGYVDRMPSSLLDSGRSLSVHIYDLSMNIPGAEHNAYAAALVLISLLLLINGSASWLTERLLHQRIKRS
ncbi:phosphate ABC transporter permease PstA [Aquabacterium sp. A7-Y]|uniref:phosphate ABC transporter permease PstA n=1 Tax=Aquabacterium sp. A7-Y TaxID=1349605 RepID=UPI00223DA7B3|nr:phosphate ABC transporter permease PstA [Aquabacterium sp. A7-Y]MCW7540992.1 phosphate ABC transporter permease PstA [Aquabacterium sp. A7-Y]